jgi:hypothetical protein
MPSIKFRTRSTAKRKATVPLYVRVTDGPDLWVKLSTLVDPCAWNNRTGKFKDSIKNSTTAKERDEVERKLNELESAIRSAMNKTSVRTKEWLQAIVNDIYCTTPGGSGNSLNDYIVKYLNEATTGIKPTTKGRRFAYGSLKSLRNFQTLFNEFQGDYTARNKEKMIKEGKELRERIFIDYSDVNIDVYNQFVKFLNDKNYSANTIGKHIKSWKTIMGESMEAGKHKNDAYKQKAFKPPSCDVDSIALSEDELNSLYTLNLPDPSEQAFRDVFLIGCWLCQRFSDYCRVNKIVTLDDGTKVVKLVQQKTGARVSVPVNLFGPGLYKTLMKYSVDGSEGNIMLPKMTDTELNCNIKLICRKAKLTSLVEITETKGGLKVTIKKEKCTVVFTHTARRSGATNLVHRGVPTQYIMKIGGWKTEREFLKYVKLDEDEVAKKMKEMNYYIKPESQLKVV